MFTIFQHSTTAYANQVNDNFYHVAQGHLLPMGGVSLTATDSVYDLGSSTYRWATTYVNNVNLYGDLSPAMNLISEVTLTATAASIDITGLNGDTDELYEIIVNGVGYATGAVYMFPNADSQTNNYGYQHVYAYGTVIGPSRNTSLTGIAISEILNDTTTAKYCKTNLVAYVNNPTKFFLLKIGGAIGNTFIRTLWNRSQVWNNSATLTSLKFTGFFDPGTNVQIWAKR